MLLLVLLSLAQVIGPQPDGTTLLNTGWRLQPAGLSIPVGTMPMSRVSTVDGKTLYVLNGGFNPPSISVIDTVRKTEIQRQPLPSAWRGLALAADGKTLYASQAASMRISRFAVNEAKLTPAGEIDLTALAPQGEAHFLGDILLTTNNRLLVADSPQNKVYVLKLPEGTLERTITTGPSPYALAAEPGQPNQIWVSHWTGSSIAAYNLDTGEAIHKIPTGPHPTEILRTANQLIVATANTNHIEFYQQRQTQWTQSEIVSVAMTPHQPVGMTPSALALSPDGKTVLAVCSDANAVAVIQLTDKRARMAGFIPTGWYPTGVAFTSNGIAILNGRGSRSLPNPKGPQSTGRSAALPDVEYVLRIQTGTVQFVDTWTEATLKQHTAKVQSLSPWRESLLADAGIPKGNPIPTKPGQPSPIKHVILLMKENRTYDQVFGDLDKGNRDPSLVLFGESITPNHHKLAREFVLLDNFYVNADVSADGYYWTTSAIAPDTTQKTMPIGYARRGPRGKSIPTPEGIRTAPGGHIWDAALRAGKTIRNYGFSAVNLPNPPATGIQIATVQDEALRPHTSMTFRQHDRAFSDQLRMKVVIDDLHEWEKKGEMPHLVLITIGNNHTEGTTPGACTPQSCVADNDQAFGQLVEALTQSRFWKDTALFVLEDDAQNGPDHVDSHRSPGFVISPYTKRGGVDSTHYSTVSMLRTIELILGLPPMTHFDASARPMHTLFQNEPDLRPYTNEPPRHSLTDLNPARSTTAARSLQLDFSGSDKADDDELNDILYLAIQGRPAPAPKRTLFGERQ